jgi:rhamnogalacturonan acetylesterase
MVLTMRMAWLIGAVALGLSPMAAQTKPIDAAPPMPVQTSVAHDGELNPKLPTLFIVGDSTARNGAALGWGDHLAALFDTTRINVANRAVAGRSSRTYYNEGKWAAVLAEMKAGDFVLIQMGHNDGGGVPTADPKSRGSYKGIGEETVELPIAKPYTVGPLVGQTTETVHSYGWYLRRYIADTRAKGATPILLTLTTRNIWEDGKVERDMGYREFETQIGAAEHVPLADMATLEADYLQNLGPEKTALLFPIDHTHTSAEGATLNAGFVAESLREIRSPVAAYLR